MRTVIASSFDFKIDAYGKAERSGQWKAPGREISGGLAFPGGGLQGRLGETPLDIVIVVIVRSNQCSIKQRGAGRPDPPRPLLPLPKCPPTRKEMSEDPTMKLRLG